LGTPQGYQPIQLGRDPNTRDRGITDCHQRFMAPEVYG
jgi:hypothetical protein